MDNIYIKEEVKDVIEEIHLKSEFHKYNLKVKEELCLKEVNLINLYFSKINLWKSF